MSRRHASVLVVLAIVAAGIAPAVAVAVTPPWDPFFAQPTTIATIPPNAFGTPEARPFGIAAGDFDEDENTDFVVGRGDGRVFFVGGNGDGTFAPPVELFRAGSGNAWALASGDVNGDGNLDVIWGATAAIGTTIADGDVRAWLGNGDGTFVVTGFTNAGTLLSNVGTDAASLTAADVEGDGDVDVVAGALDGSNAVVRLLRNSGGAFSVETIVSQPAGTFAGSPTYFPPTSTQIVNSPWGLALSDADGDGDGDLWIGDRALYVYLYLNDGNGLFILKAPNSGVPSTRTNAYLAHDSFRAAVGFTPSLGSSDINGDGKADLVLGLHSGSQTPASNVANDGLILLDVSTGSGHTGFGAVADVGTMARGVTVADVNGDGYQDVVAGVYEAGQVRLLRQLPPLDSDGDGVSDYVDNAPEHPNAARLDMNTDGSINHRDQPDNDFDTVLGDPEDSSTWQRLGDPADPDDDNDDVLDGADNCPFVANAGQADADDDGGGDACDPLDGRDTDGDGVPDGPLPGEALHEEHLAAAIRWSEGSTKFVLRNDALSRIFQNEFTQLLTDATVLSPAEWEEKCWENYGPGDGDPPDPCGTGEGTASQTLTLAGGMEVPMSLVVIPRLLWTDPPVIDWINERFTNPRLEIGQHGTYHPNNTPLGDATHGFACETCGFTEAEMFQLLKLGHDTLTGDYGNKWVAESGAAASSPKIDWSLAANPLISYAAPFNTSDAISREAMAQLGFKAFSASRFEEDPNTAYGSNFADSPSSMERFGPSGMFHVSADWQINPPDTAIADGDYSAADRDDYETFLASRTEVGGLNTWLIEEVEWSGRACNDLPRLVDCNGSPNREDNTVYGPRWEAWIHLLEYVNSHPDSVVLTMGEVALARAFDNAPTVPNADQADADHDGIGDVIEGAVLVAAEVTLSRNVAGDLTATLTNGAGGPIADQVVEFSFDADGDGTDELYSVSTDANGVATLSVTVTRPVGPTTFGVEWDGLRVQAQGGADVIVADTTTLTLAADNPLEGQVTDDATVTATLVDSDGAGLQGREVVFTIGAASGTATTDAAGVASATLTLLEPAGNPGLQASFAGAEFHGPSQDQADFAVLKEDTQLSLPDPVATRNLVVAEATLVEVDGAPLVDRTVDFYVEERDRAGETVFTHVGSAQTDAAGVASMEIPTRYTSNGRPIRATFEGDDSFLPSSVDAVIRR